MAPPFFARHFSKLQSAMLIFNGIVADKSIAPPFSSAVFSINKEFKMSPYPLSISIAPPYSAVLLINEELEMEMCMPSP